MLTPIHIIRDGYTMLTERFPKFGYEVNNQRESVCDADAELLSKSDIGHIELHLPIDFPLS